MINYTSAEYKIPEIVFRCVRGRCNELGIPLINLEDVMMLWSEIYEALWLCFHDGKNELVVNYGRTRQMSSLIYALFIIFKDYWCNPNTDKYLEPIEKLEMTNREFYSNPFWINKLSDLIVNKDMIKQMATVRINNRIYHAAGKYFEVVKLDASAYGEPNVFFLTQSPKYALYKSDTHVNVYDVKGIDMELFDLENGIERNDLLYELKKRNMIDEKDEVSGCYDHEMHRSWDLFNNKNIRNVLLCMGFQGWLENEMMNDTPIKNNIAITDQKIIDNLPKPKIYTKDEFQKQIGGIV